MESLRISSNKNVNVFVDFEGCYYRKLPCKVDFYMYTFFNATLQLFNDYTNVFDFYWNGKYSTMPSHLTTYVH